MSCLTVDLLARLEAGTLDKESGANAFQHLGSCSSCQELHREFFATAKALETIPAELILAQPRPEAWQRIKARLAEPAPASEAPLAPGAVAIACTYCKGKLARREAVYCAGCVAPHHAGCWEEHGRCASCAVSELVRAQKSSREEPRRSRTAARGLAILTLAGVSGAAAFTIGRRSSGERESVQKTVFDPGEIAPLLSPSASEAARFLARARASGLGGADASPSSRSLEQLVAALSSTISIDQDKDGHWIQQLDPASIELEARLDAAEKAFARGERPFTVERLLALARSISERCGGAAAKRFLALATRTDPGSFDAWLATADMLDDAAAAGKAIALRPDSPEAHRTRARILDDKDDATAIADLTFFLDHRKREDAPGVWTAALHDRARARERKGDHEGAAGDLSRVIELDPTDMAALCERASIWLDQRRYDASERDARAAIALEPPGEATASGDDARACLVIARDGVLDEAGALAAYKDLTDPRRKHPSRVGALRNSATTAYQQIVACRADRVRVLDEVLRRNPDASLGDLVKEAGAERARREHDAIDAIDGLSRARILLARRDVASAKKALGDVPSGDLDVEYECLAGEVALAEKDWELAASSFESALSREKESALATAGLATAWHNRVDEAAARDLFKKARALEARDDAATDESFFFGEGKRHAALARRYLDAAESAKALHALGRVLWLNPLHVLARLERARLFAAFESWDLAVEDAQAAVDADPYCAEARELLGLLFTRDLPAERDPKTLRPRSTRDDSKGGEALKRALDLAEAPGDVLEAKLLSIAAAQSENDLEGAARSAIDELATKLPADLERSTPGDATAAAAFVVAIRILEARTHAWDLLARSERSYPENEHGEPAARTALAAATRAARLRERARSLAREATERGRALEAEGKLTDALDELGKACVLAPGADALATRGQVLRKLGWTLLSSIDTAKALELIIYPEPQPEKPRESAAGLEDAFALAAPLVAEGEAAIASGTRAGPGERARAGLHAFLEAARARRDASADEARAALKATLGATDSRLGQIGHDLLELRVALALPPGEAREEALGAALEGAWTNSRFLTQAFAESIRAATAKDADRDACVRKALACLSEVRDLGRGWERLREEPGLEAIRDDARVGGFIERERADAAVRAPIDAIVFGEWGWRPDPSRVLVTRYLPNRKTLDLPSTEGWPADVLEGAHAAFLPRKSFAASLAAASLVVVNDHAHVLRGETAGDLVAAVESAGTGLLIAATSADDLRALLASPLGRVLPFEAIAPVATGTFARLEWNGQHPIGARLANPLVEGWSSAGLVHVTGLKPGAEVVATADGLPALVTGRAGKGRVAIALTGAVGRIYGRTGDGGDARATLEQALETWLARPRGP